MVLKNCSNSNIEPIQTQLYNTTKQSSQKISIKKKKQSGTNSNIKNKTN